MRRLSTEGSAVDGKGAVARFILIALSQIPDRDSVNPGKLHRLGSAHGTSSTCTESPIRLLMFELTPARARCSAHPNAPRCEDTRDPGSTARRFCRPSREIWRDTQP